MNRLAVTVGFTLFAAGVLQAASPATEWAKEEFETYTKAIFGKAPDVAFVLPGETSDFADDFAALKGTDGYAVRERNGRIVFIADCPKGHVNGVHRWLEKNSDIIWPRPANDVCFYTSQTSQTFQTSDYIDIPAFKLRFFGGGCSDDETRRYLARNAVSPTASVAKLQESDDMEAGKVGTVGESEFASARRYGTVGGFCDVWGGGHDMESRWFPRKEFFAAHPEYYMMIDGERCAEGRTNFCETNPEFVKAYSKSVEEKIRNIPSSVKIISINMEDTGLTCQCENCLKPITLADGTVVTTDDPAFRSTRFFIFFNEVARHVARIRPDLKILQFAYMHLAVPPKVKVERNVILKFCPYPRNMRESVVEGPSNVKWRERIDEWLVNTPMMYWREYYFCGCIYYPRPMADTAATDLRYIREKGVEYVYTDSPGRYGDNGKMNHMYQLNRPNSEFYDMNAMEAWVIQKLFWDPSLDPETLRAEFIRRTFGPAASDVAAFYRMLRDSWYSDNLPSGFQDNPFRSAAHYIVGKGLADRCRATLKAAEGKADSPARAELVARMRKVLDLWISEAVNYVNTELAVPFVRNEGLPAADAAAWKDALRLPRFKGLRAVKQVDRSGTETKVFADDRAILVSVDVDKEGRKVVAKDGLPEGAFPSGDKVEIMFAAAKDGYVHLAFDVNGHRYTGPVKDPKKGDWQVKAERTAKGWRAVARVPFELLGFAPQVNPSMRFNVMVSYNDEGSLRARNRNFALGGGLPHTPVSWTPIKVAIDSGASGR